MNFAVRHTTYCVSAVLLISLSPVFIEIQNMNFAVRHTTYCVSAVLLISLSLKYSLRYKRNELCC